MRDFVFHNDELKNVRIYKSKGGRSRIINVEQLTDSQKKCVEQVHQYFQSQRYESERLFIYKSESYAKAFNRARKCVTDDYAQCNVHSLRKEFANDFFEREMKKGRSEKDVKHELTLLLGHNRLDVLKHYLK